MKKCPTCDKTYEDSMRFCQIDGATLVDDAPAFDPYATIVSTIANPISLAPEEPAPTPEPVYEAAVVEEPMVEQPIVEEPASEEVADEAQVNPTISSLPIAPPSDILDLPVSDPLKTMYASETEMKDILSPAEHEEPLMEVPEIAEPPAPSFIAPEPEATAQSFGDMSPPPSPFSTPNVAGEEAVPQPAFETSYPEPVPEPAYEEPPAPPIYDEPATMIQQNFDVPFDPPQPVAEWTPPPAPEASWQNQEIGANTPFQPPPVGAGAGGENKTLAVISLVVGCLSLICCGWFVPGIVAIILGFIARGKANSDPANYGGAGLALGGMITGGISIVLGIIVVILYMLGFAASLMK